MTRGLISHKVSDYDYELPKSSIALYPTSKRDESKLLLLNRKTGEVSHHSFYELPNLLSGNDRLVVNETRVVPARIHGKRLSGGSFEILITDVDQKGEVKGLVKGLKKLKKGERLSFGNSLEAEFIRRENEFGFFTFSIKDEELEEWLIKFGQIPLPPYINREGESIDMERYQTLYAKDGLSCAAPTAGLHFSQSLLDRLEKSSISISKISLDVGPGTFKTVTVDDVRKHTVDPEKTVVPKGMIEELAHLRSEGGRVIAVGTTTTRALESAYRNGGWLDGKTDLFIYPPFDFNVIDGLLTNFHLPKSSLLMLVSAFAGREKVLTAYQEAVKEGYRFYSYGDAMLIL